jgi:predicted enzyme related to lactoylglutathione lyase
MTNAEQDRRIDYIEFSVKSVPDTKRFYGNAFGWSFEDYGPDYASFSDGRLSGGFQAASQVSTGGPLVVIYAADLEALEQKVKQAGGKIVKSIFRFPGGRRFHFTDPSGHELAVWSDR